MKKSLVIFSILSSLMVLVSSSWFTSWVWMEVNLLSFVPLLIGSKDKSSILKYFLVQASASFWLLVSIYVEEYFSIFAFLSLSMKMGAAPFHIWFVDLMKSTLKMPMFLLMSSQKVAPLYLVLSLPFSWEFYVILASSILVGMWGGLINSKISSILAYSSIYQIGWLFSAMLISEIVFMLNFIFYLLLVLMFLKEAEKEFKIHSLGSLLSLLSLSGFPMSLGFVPKLIVLKEVLPVSFLLVVMLVLSSLVPFYFYTYLSLKTMTSTFSLSSVSTLSKSSWGAGTLFLLLFVVLN